MRDETKMDVYTSGVTGAEYDAGMKQLMSNKEIIVPILQMTVSEFKTCRILCSQRPFISVKYYYADYRLWKNVIPYGSVRRMCQRNCRIH